MTRAARQSNVATPALPGPNAPVVAAATDGDQNSAVSGQVRVLARGLAILRAFTPRNEWLSNHEIAGKTALPRPTVSRLTANLTGLGYLIYSTGLRKFRLGPSVLALGYGSLANLDIRVLARAPLQQLADDEDALVVLASRDGLAMVANEVFQSRKSLFMLHVNVGSRLVLPYSAMGQALLAAMPHGERGGILRDIQREFRRDWPRIKGLIDASVEQYARMGFCTTLATLEADINGIATPVDAPGAPHSFTIGLAGPALRFPAARLVTEIGPRLLGIRHELETRLATLIPGGAASP